MRDTRIVLNIPSIYTWSCVGKYYITPGPEPLMCDLCSPMRIAVNFDLILPVVGHNTQRYPRNANVPAEQCETGDRAGLTLTRFYNQKIHIHCYSGQVSADNFDYLLHVPAVVLFKRFVPLLNATAASTACSNLRHSQVRLGASVAQDIRMAKAAALSCERSHAPRSRCWCCSVDVEQHVVRSELRMRIVVSCYAWRNDVTQTGT